VIWLKYARLDQGLTQSGLAYKAKLPQPLVSLIETGRQNPTDHELDALARALGVAASTLLQEVVVREAAIEELVGQP
jgi:transcriptional regulator with XRE-family HTH domain